MQKGFGFLANFIFDFCHFPKNQADFVIPTQPCTIYTLKLNICKSKKSGSGFGVSKLFGARLSGSGFFLKKSRENPAGPDLYQI